MAERVRLQYGDYRVMREGDPGFNKYSERRMYSPSYKKSISRREYAAKAERIPIPSPPRVEHGKSLDKHPRRTRIDKGISRADRDTILPMMKAARARQGKLPSRDIGLSRIQVARIQYEKKTGQDSDTSAFYAQYDKVRHPDQYQGNEIADAYDFLFWDEDAGDYVDDFPLGES